MRSAILGNHLKVKLNDVDVQMEADSGADVNTMDEHQFKALVHSSSVKPALQPSNVKLYTLKHKLDVRENSVQQYAMTLVVDW